MTSPELAIWSLNAIVFALLVVLVAIRRRIEKGETIWNETHTK